MILGLPLVVQLMVHLANLSFPLETLHNRCSVDASCTNNYAQMCKVGMASLSSTQNNYWDISFFPTSCISFSHFVLLSPSFSLPSDFGCCPDIFCVLGRSAMFPSFDKVVICRRYSVTFSGTVSQAIWAGYSRSAPVWVVCALLW